MRPARSRIALLAAGCAALLALALGTSLGQAAPTRWGQHDGIDWDALRAQVRAHADARRCAPRAHGGHKAGHHAHCHKPRHGTSSTKPTAGPAPATGVTGEGGLVPLLPGAPAPGEGPAGSGSGSGSGGGSGEQAPPSIVHVQVTSVEFHYTLSRTTVPAGKVAIQFVNQGQDEHNLNVLSGEGSLETAFPKTVPQGIREQTMTLRKGSFTLFCSLPEHEAKGMHATLTVQ